MSARTTRLLLVLAAFLAGLGTLFAIVLLVVRPETAAMVPSAAAIGGPFRLVDQNGQAVTDRDLKGEPYVVFFGFTHCPDVCPTTLMKLAQVRKRAGLEGLRVLFVSVDPQRDTAALLGLYLHAFDPAFLGLTGDPEPILTLAANFGVAASRVQLPGGDYTMDHSAVLFLLDARARIAAIFTPPFEVPALAADLRRAAPYL